jgi:hypothetical protein
VGRVPEPRPAAVADVTEYASLDHVDHVVNALAGRSTLALTSRVGTAEYMSRVLAWPAPTRRWTWRRVTAPASGQKRPAAVHRPKTHDQLGGRWPASRPAVPGRPLKSLTAVVLLDAHRGRWRLEEARLDSSATETVPLPATGGTEPLLTAFSATDSKAKPFVEAQQAA